MSVENITFYPNETADLNLTQLEVLAQFANGFPAKTIGYELQKATPTIVSHLNTARAFYRAKNTAHAACIAIATGDLKVETSRDTLTNLRTIKSSPIAFAFLAVITCMQDTPFLSDEDTQLSRSNRTERQVRSHRVNKRNQKELDFIF